MPTLYMIHGFIGAGKTTFARKLEQETGATRFTPDEWMIAAHGQNPPAEKFAAYQSDIEKQILAKAAVILRAGGDVIFDFGFWGRPERDEMHTFAASCGAEAKLYALQCPDDVMKKRALARTAALPGHALFIDENAFDMFMKNFEPVDPIREECLLIDSS